MAKKYDNKTPAHGLIQWSLQHGLLMIPKSIHEDRILENSQVFDFQLAPEDMRLRLAEREFADSLLGLVIGLLPSLLNESFIM